MKTKICNKPENKTFYELQLAEVIFFLYTYMKKLHILSVLPLEGTQIISTIQLCYLEYPQSSIAEDFYGTLWTMRPWQTVKFEIEI